MKRFFFFLILSCFVGLSITPTAFTQDNTSIIGKWKTIDDKTNEPKSIINIYEKDGKYYGQIIELFIKPGDDPNPTCDECADDDPRKDQPTKGMVVLQDLVEDEGEYVDGTILDPADGKVYDCKLWIEDGNLQVRGYILFLYRTQTWLRVE